MIEMQNEQEEREELIGKLNGVRAIRRPDLETKPIEELRLYVGIVESMVQRGREAREQGEREELLEKARSFHVPGHGPNFTAMSNEEIRRHIEIIDAAFERAFSEEDDDDDYDTDDI